MAHRGPFKDSRMTRYLEKRILELRSRKTQAEIASKAGFRNVNVLAMIKAGTIKAPLDRVPALAQALECDAALLFQMALEQTDGDTTAATVRQIFNTIVSANEAAWIEEIRRASDNSDPALTQRARSTIRGIFGK